MAKRAKRSAARNRPPQRPRKKKAAAGSAPRAKRGSSKLATYRRKRDFERTPEPQGGVPTGEHLRYVVQKHDATRLHYDFRLEHDGVLKSWAVPKAPSLDPKDRRLAVQTEDHPLDYGNFEGEIPEGEYGAGSVLIWDRGWWQPLADPERGLADGKLDFELHGDRLEGRWTLVRMAHRGTRRGPDNWLLIKRSEPAAATTRGMATRRAKAGGRTKSKPRARRAPSRARATRTTRPPLEPDAAPGARQAALPAAPRPQLATLVNRPPDGEGWLHEAKLDGYRLLCRIDGGAVALLTRRGNDWHDRFSAIVAAARELPCRSALLDGEAVVFDSRGLSSFQRLQNALAEGGGTTVLVAFDLLYLDGWDLTDAPLHARKRLLQELLDGAPPAIRYGEHFDASGSDFFAEACRAGLEGVVSKRADDPYRAARTRSWLKAKCLQRQELVIVGYTDPAGSRTGFGALLLGVRAPERDALRYVGKVGTGFDELALRTLKSELDRRARKSPPVDAQSARGIGRGVHWVEPELVAEISFTEWTADGRLRHPVFHGLREDKAAREVVEERPTDVPAAAAPRPRRVKLTHPDKILFADPGITKGQLAHYWEQVAEYALPYIERRPLTLFRCPDGYGAQCFYQKHLGVGTPDVIPRVVVTPGEDPYGMVDGIAALLGLVQIGVLELHLWGSRAEHLDQPDICVFDLDPSEELPWSAVVAAARDLKARLEALGLVPFARLTGGKGLHLVVPVVPGPAWPAVKKFTRAVVDELVRDEPKRFTASVSKSRRGGKIFVDYLRNDRESTAIASYSPRARAGAPIALPIAWDDLDDGAATPPRFSLLEVPKLLRSRSVDPWAGFEAARRSLVE
jgi:bifunctional non-homologous end joining protein LigD